MMPLSVHPQYYLYTVNKNPYCITDSEFLEVRALVQFPIPKSESYQAQNFVLNERMEEPCKS